MNNNPNLLPVSPSTPQQETELHICIDALKKIMPEEIAVKLFYPVYLNTYALVNILESNGINAIETEMFDWNNSVPSQLLTELDTRKKDVIYCFSSSDKEAVFRKEVKRFIEIRNLNYEVSEPFGKQQSTGGEDIYTDIQYSNFSLKYLFFQNKVNIKELHSLGLYGNFFFRPGKHPYLSKLLSALLVRGYKSIHIDTEVTDESKGLLRKVLHEEFGFKFQLTPKYDKLKDNYILIVETKGGQQAYEEVKLQSKALSDKLTFEIPDRIKYTSKTKLIAIYRNDTKHAAKNKIRNGLAGLSKYIFDSTYQPLLFKADVARKFADKNIDFILKEVLDVQGNFSASKLRDLLKDNYFLKSLEPIIKTENLKKIIKSCHDEKNFNAHPSKEELLNMIDGLGANLQINDILDFITCLNDHHVTGKEDEIIGDLKRTAESFDFDFTEFARKIILMTPKVHQNKMLNGLFLLREMIRNPNGYPRRNLISIDRDKELLEKKRKDRHEFEFESMKLSGSPMNKEVFVDFYNKLRMIAEDMTYLVLEEALLCDPKVIINIMEGFDISEFEYLFSITMLSEVYNCQ